jgi:MFS family permease
MFGPILPLYLEQLHAGVAQIGLFFTLSAVIPLALQILGGWVSDSVGRLPDHDAVATGGGRVKGAASERVGRWTTKARRRRRTRSTKTAKALAAAVVFASFGGRGGSVFKHPRACRSSGRAGWVNGSTAKVALSP